MGSVAIRRGVLAPREVRAPPLDTGIPFPEEPGRVQWLPSLDGSPAGCLQGHGGVLRPACPLHLVLDHIVLVRIW